MGNLFLGFPVARAKIADMISTSAPPALHKTQHQAGGTDELNVTGLVGAGGGGGVTLPFNDYYFDTKFDSIDSLAQSTVNTGTVTLAIGSINLEVQAVSSDYAEISKYINYHYVTPSWAKNREFRTMVFLRSYATSLMTAYVSTGDPNSGYGFGFYVNAGNFYARCRNGVSYTETLIEAWGASGFSKTKKLRAVFTAGSKIEYYVDDVLVATITTNLPTGTSDAFYNMLLTLQSPASSSRAKLELSHFMMTQSA